MIRTRFAPSPTGYLHIGGVRTALFNWLLARQTGGQFVLRIDDTDRARNVEEALQPILDGFRWLGIDWDEGPDVGGDAGPYYQSQRSDLHASEAARLLASGHAYRDYATTDEIQQERTAAEREKRPFSYSRKWMATTNEEAAKFENEGRSAVIRLRMPREGKCVFTDAVRGVVEFDWAREQDHVIQRADGSCLYHLASVVDDHAMRISHVVRAEEHLSNTPRQIFIAQSLDYELPVNAHLPYVAEPGGKNKISKRKLDKYLKNPDFKKLFSHGQSIAERLGLATVADTFNPVIIDFYQQVGFLPDAILNYLLLLGWSLDDKTENFSRSEMIEQFSLDRVVKSPASFDPSKLMAFQDRYMRELPIKQKTALAVPFLQEAQLVSQPPECDLAPTLTCLLESAGDRIKVLGDVISLDEFFVSDDKLEYDEKAIQKRLQKPPRAVELLVRFRQRLADTADFDTASLDQLMHTFVEDEGIKIGEVIHAVRVAVTGKSVGIGLFDALSIIGRESCLARIDFCVQQFGGSRG